MFIWCLLLLVYILISYFIDIRTLPFLLRHLWNLVPFVFGFYLIYQSKKKQRIKYRETLESRVAELDDLYEGLKYNTLNEKLTAIEERLIKLEGKLKG